jgi:hypothetical protein
VPVVGLEPDQTHYQQMPHLSHFCEKSFKIKASQGFLKALFLQYIIKTYEIL